MSESSNSVRLVIFWALVLAPLGWGVYHTMMSAMSLFN